jgi:NADH-quinone oxidoreductase subunit E
MAQIGKDYYEDLTAARFAEILDELVAGEVPVPGPQNGRYAAEPKSGLTSLTDFESGRHKYNASVQLATDIGDTVKRIDGTEIPLLHPWGDAGGRPQTVAKAANDVTTPSRPAAEAAPKPENAPSPDAASMVKPSSELAGETELAARKGTWKYAKATTAKQVAREEPSTPAPEAAEGPGTKPETLTEARDGQGDDLKRIKGIGPKLAELCNRLGFFHFDQIAGWTADEVAWVDQNLEGFKGRVSRDNWVEQAKTLASGGETEFSARVKKGDVYDK